MKKYLLSLIAFSLAFLLNNMNLSAGEVVFKWFGQSCFMIETSSKIKIITDPVDMGEYKVPKEIEADIVTVSHEHFDHNKVDVLSGKPEIIRGLTSGGKEIVHIDKKIKDVRVYTVASFHDDKQGSMRGLNAIFVYEFDGIKVAHLGDLGHTLSEEQVRKIGAIDVLMIPVGGKYTIHGEDADQVIAQLKPKLIVFPMHFKTDTADFLPYSGEDYTKGKDNVRIINSNSFQLDLNNPPLKLEYVVLNYT